MEPEIAFTVEQFEDYPAVCVEETGPYPVSAPDAWNTLWSWINAKNLGDSVRRPIGYGMDDPAYTQPHDLRYRACLVLHTMPEISDDDPVEQITIPGGAYAVHRMTGPYMAMPSTFAFLKRCIAEQFELDIYRPFQEIYINDPQNAAPEELMTDLCIPVKRPN